MNGKGTNRNYPNNSNKLNIKGNEEHVGSFKEMINLVQLVNEPEKSNSGCNFVQVSVFQCIK